ncbi:MFS transporter [Nonomuraea aurantiaca]|uniref:MFS transporter n=1 Tax=Nonomuraea aurantiaca TaxID=2878562 RepID=UPI001CD9DDB3|nr:MFS transporter [Nonomuraea aurantiaca]MCA2222592.1 MFS transporter [Nonomuraea aurantiaca]
MRRPATDEERPAGYRDLFVLVEYRAVFTASVLSWIGDYLCKAAVALLVFDRTGSVLASAAAFAVGYLPWLTAGPLLAAVAERYPSRSVMIFCDLVRAALIGLIAIPGVPVAVLLVLLFASGLFAPPFEAARSSQLPHILTGDLYPLGIAFNNAIFHLAQVFGYAAGGMIAGYNPHAALLLNAGTFVGSAFLLRRYVKLRPATLGATHRLGLWRETGQGYAVVFGDPVMRAIALITFATVTFVIVPEGLAAAWAAEIDGGGAAQGFIMAANPLGVAIGGLILTRLLRSRTRTRLIRPLAVLAPLTLVPALLDLPLAGVLLLVAASGVVMSLLLPAAQALFKSVLPTDYRARAFGVMNSGIQIAQGTAILATGALSERFPTSSVIGAWCGAGVVLMLFVTFRPLVRPEPSAPSPDPAERTR